MRRSSNRTIFWHAAVAVFAVALIVVPASAQNTFTWTGNNNNNWDNNGNWTGTSGWPDSTTDSVVFNSSGSHRNVDLRGGNRDVATIGITLLGSTDYSFDSNTNGSGTLRLNGNMSIAAMGDSVTFHDATSDSSGGHGIDLVQAADGTWTNAGAVLTVYSNLTGSATIDMYGNVTFNHANDYTGNFQIDSGVTKLGDSNAFANAVVTLNSDNGLGLNSLSSVNLGALQGSGNLDIGGSILNVAAHSSNRTFSGNLTGTAFQGAAMTYSGAYLFTLTGSLSDINSVSSLNGVIVFSGGNSTIVGDAELILNGGNISITNDASVNLSALAGSGSLVTLNSNTLSIDGGKLTTARILGNTDGTVDLISDPSSGAALIIGETMAGSKTSTYAGLLSGSGTVQKVGTGTWTLTNANSFDGTAQIDGGSVILGNASALQNATAAINLDDGLDVNGLNATIGALAGSGNLDIAGTTLTLAGSTDASYSGNLSGTDACQLISQGSGTQTFASPNSDFGSLRVNAGDFVVDGGGLSLTSLANGFSTASLLVRGGTMTIQNGAHVAFNDSSGAYAYVTSGELDLTGTNTVLSGRRVDIRSNSGTNSATVQVSNGAAMNIAQTIILANSTGPYSLTVNSGGSVSTDLFIAGQDIGGIANVDVTGANSHMQIARFRLGGENSSRYGSTATIVIEDGGALDVSSLTSFFTDTSSLTIDGGTFSTDTISEFSTVTGDIAISDPMGSAALTIGTNDGSSTYNGSITDAAGGAGSVDKVGTGTLELTGDNTFTGGVVVDGGTLLANNTSGSATGSGGVAVNDGGTLGGSGTAAGTTTVESGGTVAPGDSAGALTVDDVTFNSGSTFAVEIGGTTAGTDFDQLVVNNTATLAGTLDVSYIAPFTATSGQSFVILTAGSLSGTFDTVIYPDSQTWSVAYDTQAGTVTLSLCPDSDGDGVCNANDICPGFNDNIDTDGDGVPDGCDPCPNRKPGDVNGDSAVSVADVAPFAAVLLDPAAATPDNACAADVNNDGNVDGLDIQAFTQLILGA